MDESGQYAVFSWGEHGAVGGWNDMIGRYPTLGEARVSLPETPSGVDPNSHFYVASMWQIVDLSSGLLVDEGHA